MINQSAEKDNKFILTIQIFKDGKIHETKTVTVSTSESTARGHYDKVKNDLIKAYKELYPDSEIAIVVLTEQKIA